MKKTLSLILALLMILSLCVTSVSAETTDLTGKTVTLTITPDKSAVCVNGTSDVYVEFTVKLKSNDGTTPIPAFAFNLEPDTALALAEVSKGAAASTATPDYYWWVNTEVWSVLDGTYKAPYNEFSYTASPNKYFGAAGTQSGAGITTEAVVMTIMARIPAGTTAGTYRLSAENFIAGDGNKVNEIVNQFGTCTVVPGTVTVNAPVTVSGKLTDGEGSDITVSSGTVELYSGSTKVATATPASNGTYSFSDVSTGSYTVKAVNINGNLNGSKAVTVEATDVTVDDIKVQQYAKGDVTLDGNVNSDDVTALLRHVSKIEYLSEEAAALADVNDDTAVNSDDVTKLLRFVSKIDPSL